MVNPSLGLKLHALKVHRLSAPGIFLISGLLLKLEEVQQAVRSPLPLIVGKEASSHPLFAALLRDCFFCFLL